MGTKRQWTDVEKEELLNLFPLEKGVPPFGTKLARFAKKWDRGEKAVKAYYRKMANTSDNSTPYHKDSLSNMNLENLSHRLRGLRDFLTKVVEELDSLIGD